MSLRRLTAVAVITLAAFPASADASRKLSFAAIEVPPSVAPGGAFAIEGEVQNRGTRRAATRVRASLEGEATTTGLGSARLRVPGGAGKRFSIAAQIPATAPPGPHRVLVCMKRHGRRGKPRCGEAPMTVTSNSEDPPQPPPNFTPGARTLDDPLIPQLGNGGYDALDYEIELIFDPVANELENGTRTTMTATATQDLSELSMDFQDDLAVSSVTVDSNPATFAQVPATPALAGGGTQPQKLVITPATGIPEGRRFEVAISYAGTPAVFTDPDGAIEGWIPGPTCPVPATCAFFVVGEPFGSQTWFPSNNHPSDKATLTTEITIPSTLPNQSAVGVGELAGAPVSNGDGTTTWTWREDDPTASYLATASSGAYERTESAVAPALGPALQVDDFVETAAPPTAKTEIAELSAGNKLIIDTLAAHYGPYPFDSLGSVWQQNPQVGYALEVQTKSHFSLLPAPPVVDVESTYVHELAHQWFGNAVTAERWNDLWFNEGWAVLSEWLYDFEVNAGPSPEQRWDDEYASTSHDWSVAPAVLNDDPALMFSPPFPTYTRGAMTIQGFREIVGQAAFDGFAQGLQSEYAYDNVSTEEFIAEAKAASGFTGAKLQLLHEYFQQWLFGTVKPTVTPEDF